MSGYIQTAKTHEWETPQDLFDKLNAEFHFELDPCATIDNAKCDRFFTIEQDGLAQDWTQYRSIFVNPPYGREIALWAEKAYETARSGKSTVVLLVPARTDTKWFHDYVLGKAEIRFIRGRIRFGGAKAGAPFPSVIIIYSPDTGGKE